MFISEERRKAMMREAQKEEVAPVKAVPTEPEKPKYRYACHGCTQVALVSTNCMVDVMITCQFCGLAQIAKPENWLPL